MKVIDMVGRTFGRLTVLRLAGSVKKQRRWVCLCECGTETTVQGGNLRSGASQSCGCLHHEQFVMSRFKHGHGHGTRAYASWCSMKTRCTNPNWHGYHKWGGRGIKVCDRWLNSFETFLADMGEPLPGYSLDRWPNNDGDYEPGNCRWATPKEQARNTRQSLPSRRPQEDTIPA